MFQTRNHLATSRQPQPGPHRQATVTVADTTVFQTRNHLATSRQPQPGPHRQATVTVADTTVFQTRNHLATSRQIQPGPHQQAVFSQFPRPKRRVTRAGGESRRPAGGELLLSIIGARLPRRSAQGLKVVVVAGNSEAALSLGRWTKTPHTLSEFWRRKVVVAGTDCRCILYRGKFTRS